jgi:hypothetical protein
MKSPSKVMLVVGGYLLAFVIASIVVSIYVAATNGSDRQTYSGMFAFGDSLLFLGVLAVAAIPATGIALVFLRPYRTFWSMVSGAALVIAASGAAALATYLLPSTVRMNSFLGVWAELAPLRILLAPPLALAFFLCCLFAPTRAPRIRLLCASVIETVAFLGVALIWFHPFP